MKIILYKNSKLYPTKRIFLLVTYFLSAINNTVFKLNVLKNVSPSIYLWAKAKMKHDLVSLPSIFHHPQKLVTFEEGLKGLSYEIDFENVDEN